MVHGYSIHYSTELNYRIPIPCTFTFTSKAGHTQSSSFIILVSLDEFNTINLQKISNLIKDWIHISCSVVSNSNHNTRIFSVLVWVGNWLLFHAWVILSNLFNSSFGQKSLHFEKKIECLLLIASFFPVFNVISHGLNLISHKIIYFIWGGKNSQRFKQNPCFNQ